MKTTLTLFILSIHLAVNSQSHYLGTKGGISWCNALIYQTKGMTRYLCDLEYDYRFRNNLKIGGGIQYNQLGYNYLITTDESDIKFFYDYVAIPLTIGFEHGNKWFGYGDAGVVTSFFIQGKVLEGVIDPNSNKLVTIEYKLSKQYQPPTLGLSFAIGTGYNVFNNFDVLIEGNFYRDIARITANENFILFDKYRISALLGVRYKFGQ